MVTENTFQFPYLGHGTGIPLCIYSGLGCHGYFKEAIGPKDLEAIRSHQLPGHGSFEWLGSSGFHFTTRPSKNEWDPLHAPTPALHSAIDRWAHWLHGLYPLAFFAKGATPIQSSDPRDSWSRSVLWTSIVPHLEGLLSSPLGSEEFVATMHTFSVVMSLSLGGQSVMSLSAAKRHRVLHILQHPQLSDGFPTKTWDVQNASALFCLLSTLDLPKQSPLVKSHPSRLLVGARFAPDALFRLDDPTSFLGSLLHNREKESYYLYSIVSLMKDTEHSKSLAHLYRGLYQPSALESALLKHCETDDSVSKPFSLLKRDEHRLWWCQPPAHEGEIRTDGVTDCSLAFRKHKKQSIRFGSSVLRDFLVHPSPLERLSALEHCSSFMRWYRDESELLHSFLGTGLLHCAQDAQLTVRLEGQERLDELTSGLVVYGSYAAAIDGLELLIHQGFRTVPNQAELYLCQLVLNLPHAGLGDTLMASTPETQYQWHTQTGTAMHMYAWALVVAAHERLGLDSLTDLELQQIDGWLDLANPIARQSMVPPRLTVISDYRVNYHLARAQLHEIRKQLEEALHAYHRAQSLSTEFSMKTSAIESEIERVVALLRAPSLERTITVQLEDRVLAWLRKLVENEELEIQSQNIIPLSEELLDAISMSPDQSQVTRSLIMTLVESDLVEEVFATDKRLLDQLLHETSAT